jgi:peptidoglycan/xylan/chitin deacetylase (PgdA/CDA1 family)
MLLNKNFIVNFHKIDNPVWLKRILLYLKENYNILPISEIEDFFYNNKSLKRSCHITIDDGHVSVYRVIFPLIKELNIPISIYVSPKKIIEQTNFWFQELEKFDEKLFKIGLNEYFSIKSEELNSYSNLAILKNLKIDQIIEIIEIYKKKYHDHKIERQCLNIEELKELHDSGLVSIGAHTQNHPILANEDDSTSEFEIFESITQLGELLKTPIKYFVYPNGGPNVDFGFREIEILKKYGIKLAFSTKVDKINRNMNPLAIPRIGFSHGNLKFVKRKIALSSYYDVILKLFGKYKNDCSIRGNIKKNINKYNSNILR